MKRLGLARVLGVLSVVAACGDDGSMTPGDSESSGADDNADDIGDESTGSVDTTDGESSSADTNVDSTGAQPVCGDDVVDVGEECDGTDLGGEDCVGQGFDRGALACAADCTFDTSACIMATCGNGKAEGREICDGEDLDGHDCLSEGFDGGEVTCERNCLGFSTAGCFVCGDGDIDGSEACDGENLNDETCMTQGFASGELVCAADCSGFVTDDCSDTPACVEEDLGSVVGVGIEGGTTVGEDENLSQVCGSGGAVDHVLLWTAPNEGVFQIDTFGSGYDTALALYNDCRSPEFACNDDSNGLQSRLIAGVTADQELIISVNGYNGATGEWLLSITEIETSGPCCAPHPEIGCDDAVCTGSVCALDPLCCDALNGWDSVCTDLAATNCADCMNICGNNVIDGMPLETCDGLNLGGASCQSEGFDFGTLGCMADCTAFDTSGCGDSGDCCTDNGAATPGCTDDSCEALICATNPSCCTDTWDATCAALAATDCAVCNPGVCGNNLVDAMGEVCDGVDVGGEDCLTQGFIGGQLGCAEDCSGLDPSGCFDANEDCCFDDGNGLPDCNDAGCSDAICAVDSYCCTNIWDSICVAEALGFCTLCNGGEGDCCTDTGDVGCNDAFCVEAICGAGGLDPTCCTVSWTAACTDLANANCPVCA